MKKIIILILIWHFIIPGVFGVVSSVDYSPSSPTQGDTLNINILASANEEVDITIVFEKEVPVENGGYKYELFDVLIPQRPNKFSVKATGVDNLVVAVRMMGIWVSLNKDASGGVATISQSNIPSDHYDTQIKGDAAVGQSTVHLKITAQTTVTTESDGHYTFYYDTSSLPPGTFTANVGGVTKTLTLKSASSSSSGGTPTILPPVARFQHNGSLYVNDSIIFDASDSSRGTGSIVSYSWDFGDGTTGSGETISHVFNTIKTYAVTLTVKDSLNQVSTITSSLDIGLRPNEFPIAVAGSSRTAFTGQNLTFNGHRSVDPDGDIISYLWEFDDGTISTNGLAEHVFLIPGRYNVTLTVTDDRHDSSTNQIEITVVEPPSPISNEVQTRLSMNNNLVEALGVKLVLNTTSEVNVLLYEYTSNPHPQVELPSYTIGPVIDVSVSDPDAVQWPVYFELSYSGMNVTEALEMVLGLYYYEDETWHRCDSTGAYPERDVVWAFMTREEMSGSPVLIGEVDLLPVFNVSDLVYTPESPEVGDLILINVKVTNTGDKPEDAIVLLEINDEPVNSSMIYLHPSETVELEFHHTPADIGEMTLRVDDLTQTLVINPRTYPDLVVKQSSIPDEVLPSEAFSMVFWVTNQGDKPSDSFVVKLTVNDLILGSKRIQSLDVGEEIEVSFNWVSTITGEFSGSLDLDINGDVEETIEDNNAFKFSIAVTQPSNGNFQYLYGVVLIMLLVLAWKIYPYLKEIIIR
ncbi:MAG: PKD domain-containing protein [Candidatus Bathyarchaeota archaeon]|nr:PKD domain-containing protein [Candidatus Bathyarchaeota archaeon]